MALARSRQATRRVKDRWKAKRWYQITAPIAFNSHLLGQTMADEPEKLQGRTVEVTLHELTGDMRQMHVKLTFQVSEIQDTNAKTVFAGHTMTSDYVRRLTRRGNSKVSAVFDLQTKDGSRVRVKPFAVCDRRTQTTARLGLRNRMQEVLEEAAKKHNLSGFIGEILVGDLTQELNQQLRKIRPLRRVEIAKTEILKAPAVETDETPIIKPAEPEPEKTEEAETTEGEGTESEATEDEATEEPEGEEADSEEETTDPETIAADGEEE